MSGDKEPCREVREQLEARRTLLAGEISNKLASARNERVAAEGVTATDGGDQASLCAAGEIELAEARRDGAELLEIDAALGRLANGTYGFCIDCGCEVAPERLAASPAASRCKSCQNLAESRRRPFVNN